MAVAPLAAAPLMVALVFMPASPLKAQPAGDIKVRPLDKAEAKGVSYSRQIHPLLQEKCGSCHSGAKPSADFSVSSYKLLMKGGKQGAAIFPGKPDASLMVQYIRGQKTPRMPMGGDPLTTDQLHLIRQWIAAGALNDANSQKPNSGGKANDKAVPSPTKSGGPVEDESSLTLAQIRDKHLARLPAPPKIPTVSAPAFNAIDRFIAAQWESSKQPSRPIKLASSKLIASSKLLIPAKLPAPALCDDATFVRRVYLDVVGIVPTAEEARAFVSDKSKDKRARLIDRLLARDADYAAHWMPFWEDALASNGKHQGGAGSRANLRPWLTENLKRNRPYDEMVVELIDPTFDGATVAQARGWIRNGDHVETTQSAANAAQIFLGTSVKCASCHNHFLNKEWPQRKVVALSSFFSEKDLELIRCEVKQGEFIAPQWIFDQPAARQAAPRDLNGRLKQVARLVVDPENPRFARSLVNRLWKRYLGLGLVEPADDFRADRKASHPELLSWLADDFMRHGYDLKHTIRLILNSRTYQLRYHPKLADSFDVAKPDAPRFYRSPTLRRLTAEQLVDSINAAIGNAAPRLYLDENSTALTRVLGKPAARNEVATARPDDVAVVQALELLNGEELNAQVAQGTLAGELSREKDATRAITRAYWSIYSRAPTPAEIAAGRALLASDAPPAQSSDKSGAEEVWMEDEPPAGAKLQGNWQWIESGVQSGKRAHTAPPMPGAQQHYFIDAPQRLKIGFGDTLFVYAYIDPAARPRQIMLQWNDGSWEHRAYWGENLIPYGADGTASRLRLGDLPAAGGWVRLEIPANRVGLGGREIHGMSFDQFDGRVLFDRAGIIRAPQPSPAVVDMLWALFANPEFQYIR